MFRRASVWRFLTSSILAALVAARHCCTGARAERHRLDRRRDRRSDGRRDARRHRHRRADDDRPHADDGLGRERPLPYSAAAGRRVRRHRRALRFHSAQAARADAERRADGHASHPDGRVGRGRNRQRLRRNADHRDQPLAGQLDDHRSLGAEPARQRPQLHRLRAADARRHARRAHRRHQLRRSARHAQQPGRRRRRQQQHVLRPDRRPHRFGTGAVSVQPGRRQGVPGQLELVLGRVRPRRRRRHQRRHQVRHERPARIDLRVLSRQGAQREQRDQRAEQPAEVAVSLQPVRRHARRADSSEPRFLLLQLRRPAQHAAERRLPEPAGEHADRCGDAGGHRAAAAARRELETHARSGRLPHQDRPRAERHQSPVLPLQPAELHRRGLRERRRAELDRAHRRVAGEDQHASTRAGPASSARRSSTS